MHDRVSVIQSTTWEEPCSQTRAWPRQRTRCVKGYLITTAVNTRHPARFYREPGLPGTIGLFGLILGTPLAFLLYPIALGFFVITYIGVQFVNLDLPPWVLFFGAGNVFMGDVSSDGASFAMSIGWAVAMAAYALVLVPND